MGDCRPLPDCPHEGKAEDELSCGERCECEARRRAAEGSDPEEKLFQTVLWLGLGILIPGLALLFAHFLG